VKLLVAILSIGLVAQLAVGEAAEWPQNGEGQERVYTVEDPQLRPDGPRTQEDIAYESRVLGAYRNQQGQGLLDGSWHVQGRDGKVIYTLQLHDPGAGEARIEGAWSNPNIEGADGFIDAIWREGAEVVFSFRDGPAADTLVQLRLIQGENGVWSGEQVRNGVRSGIIANRAQGLETAAMAVPAYVQPRPAAPPPKAKAQPKTKLKSKSRRNRR
jgi:hypothetical protein